MSATYRASKVITLLVYRSAIEITLACQLRKERE